MPPHLGAQLPLSFELQYGFPFSASGWKIVPDALVSHRPPSGREPAIPFVAHVDGLQPGKKAAAQLRSPLVPDELRGAAATKTSSPTSTIGSAGTPPANVVVPLVALPKTAGAGWRQAELEVEEEDWDSITVTELTE